MIIGSHVSFTSTQLLGSVKEALSYGANALMFYTGAPQNTLRKEINEELTKEAHALMKENNIARKNVICHAPYIINLANKKDPEKWQFSINFLKEELSRCEKLGVDYIVLHPGSSVGLPEKEAIQNIIEALNLSLENNPSCKILLETMAKKGTEIGSLEEIKEIMDHVSSPLGVCLDTCHINDVGYSLKDFDEFLKAFDKIIGLQYLFCVHLNDSKNPCASHKDRHANIGYGTIGFEVLDTIAHHPKLKDIPKILETPYVGESLEDKKRIYPPYYFEIKMLKERKWDDSLIEHIHEKYKLQ